MVEAELAFADNLGQLCDVIESFVKRATTSVLKSAADDCRSMWPNPDERMVSVRGQIPLLTLSVPPVLAVSAFLYYVIIFIGVS